MGSEVYRNWPEQSVRWWLASERQSAQEVARTVGQVEPVWSNGGGGAMGGGGGAWRCIAVWDGRGLQRGFRWLWPAPLVKWRPGVCITNVQCIVLYIKAAVYRLQVATS